MDRFTTAKFELMNNNLSVDQLNVLSSIDTVRYLSKKHTSFCRFGDGEIEIIMGWIYNLSATAPTQPNENDT